MCLRFPVIMNLIFSTDYCHIYERVWSNQIIYITQRCGLLGQHIYKAKESGCGESWGITTVFIIVAVSVGAWLNLINMTVGAQWQ